jgi:hypothetical protein
MRQLFMILICLNCSLTFSQSVLNFNASADSSLKKTENELKIVCQKILTEYPYDTAFIKNFNNSQMIWIEYRNAQVKMKYPDNSYLTGCVARYSEILTKERINTIKKWIDRVDVIEVSNLCNGSIKIQLKTK